MSTKEHDTATLSSLTANQSANSTAKVTYSFYKTNDCTERRTPHTEDLGDWSADVCSAALATGALGAGSYSYKAVYSGNDNYKSATGDCEPFKISQGSPTISTDRKSVV